MPGTHCTIIPPPYFLPSETFIGFTGAEADASVLVVDSPVPAAGMADSFISTIGPKSPVMKLKKHDTVSIEGKPFSLLTYAQTAGEKAYEKQILFLGDARNTLMVMATYPTENSGLAPVMRACLLSARFHKNLTANPEAAAPFSVDGASQGFTAQKYGGSVLTYRSRERLYGSEGIYAITMQPGVLNPEEKEAYLEQQLQKMGDKDMEVLSLKPVTIQYLNGYKLLGRRQSAATTHVMHLTVLFQEDAGLIYTLLGIAESRPRYWHKRFEALAQSFKLK